MARMPRLVVPGLPHHVTQRGTRRMQTFFGPDDYASYLALLVEHREQARVDIWAYCLMPNHIHLVVVPQDQGSLATYFGHVHKQYTRRINFREGWKGHLWQERFHSFVMDESHLYAAVRYTELNPVRARLCQQPQDWPWSSVHAHLAGADNDIVLAQPMLERVSDWQTYLSQGLSERELARIRQHGRTGRPAGNDVFLETLRLATGKDWKKRKPGPKAAIK